jgi:HEPN domain-containing protein
VKKRPNGPDPFKMFMNAERYRRADLLLRSAQDPQLAVAVASPALILSAFASEIYLKCIICLQTGALAHGHHLKKLFRQISPKTRRKIEQRWDAYASAPQKQRLYAALSSMNGSPVPTSLEWTLSEGSNAFTSLRYLHETDENKTKFLLGDFPNMLREEIVELKPEWANLVHGPMKPVPGFEDPIF